MIYLILFISSFIFPIGCVSCSLFVALLSRIRDQVLTRVFRSSIPTFMVVMAILTSWLWLDQIMFWFVPSLTSFACNRSRPELVMTDAPDTVDAFVGTPLGTSDHCFVSCVLPIEQSVRSTMSEVLSFWSNVLTRAMSAVRSGALHGAPFWNQLIY